MLGAIAIIPSAPVLVPELAGAAASELADLTAAVLESVALLPPRWIVVGAGAADEVVGPGAAGTFAGFGVDVPVKLSPGTGTGIGAEGVDLPLCALIAAWARGKARPEASAQVRVWRDDLDSGAALTAGRRLRVELAQGPEPVGVLVVADGANTLTPTAPGGYDEQAADHQLALDDALASGDVAVLAQLPEQIRGRVAFQVLAGLAEPGPRLAKELHRAAPYGVGYFVGFWQP